jgi:hypothetical protein
LVGALGRKKTVARPPGHGPSFPRPYTATDTGRGHGEIGKPENQRLQLRPAIDPDSECRSGKTADLAHDKLRGALRCKEVGMAAGNIFRVIRLVVRNVRRIKAVEIEPPRRGGVIIGGANAQGKTSVTDAILAAVGGAHAEHRDMVRHGQKDAEILLDLGGVTIRKKISADGTSSLELRAKDGASISKPQKWLDEIVGRFSFDPLAFLDMPPKERVRVLLECSGHGEELAALERRRLVVFEHRRDENVRVRDARGQLREVPDSPGERIDTGLLVAEFENVRAARSELIQKTENIAALERRLGHINRQLDELATTAAELQRERNDVDAALGTERVYAETLVVVAARGVEITARLDEVRAQNARVDNYEMWQRRRDELSDREAVVAAMSAEIQSIDDEKADLLADLALPVKGLGFDGEDVTFNGEKWAQLSQSETLRISMAVAMALNPQLRILRIKEGALLDDDHLAEVCAIAAANDYQVWIETVGDRGPTSIIIEDGGIARRPVAATNSATTPEDQ